MRYRDAFFKKKITEAEPLRHVHAAVLQGCVCTIIALYLCVNLVLYHILDELSTPPFGHAHHSLVLGRNATANAANIQASPSRTAYPPAFWSTTRIPVFLNG